MRGVHPLSMTDSTESDVLSANGTDAQAAATPERDGAPRDGVESEAEEAARVAPCNGDRRSRQSFWLDTVTALSFSALLGTGILLEFMLPRRGGGTWLGWTRHGWGEVHLWLGVALVVLVVLHLIQHREWISRCWRRFAGSVRSPLTWALLLAGATLIAAPLLIPVQPGGGGRGQRGEGARAGEGRDGARHDRQGMLRGRGSGRRGAERGAARW